MVLDRDIERNCLEEVLRRAGEERQALRRGGHFTQVAGDFLRVGLEALARRAFQHARAFRQRLAQERLEVRTAVLVRPQVEVHTEHRCVGRLETAQAVELVTQGRFERRSRFRHTLPNRNPRTRCGARCSVWTSRGRFTPAPAWTYRLSSLRPRYSQP